MAGGENLTDYERQRLRRIEENRSRLAALGLPELTTSLSKKRACLPESSGRKSERIQRKNKRASRKDVETDDHSDPISASDWEEEEEDEYENDDDRDYEPLSTELNLSEYDDDDDEDVDKDEEDDSMYNPISKSKKDPKSKRAFLEKGSKGHQQYIDPLLPESTLEEEDEMALQQALALSLGSPLKDAVAASEKTTEQADNLVPKHSRNEGRTSPKSMKRMRPRKDRKNILQFNEEEINTLFLAFVGSENDQISFRELQDAAVAQDFTWSKNELDDMITFFDIDGNHKLNIMEFRNMAVRCNMLRQFNA